MSVLSKLRKRKNTSLSFVFRTNTDELGLKHSPAPVSIITDGATDETQNHYLVVLPQTIEDNQPKVVFYRLLEITDGEGAEDLKKLLVKAFSRGPY